MAVTPRTVAIEVAREAGHILGEHYGRANRVRYKGEVDLVTEIDERSEALIVGRIQAHFPEHNILSEESGSTRSPETDSAYRWIIDPLDGTTNFAHGYPFFCVSIALQRDGETILGVVYAPTLDELFVAELGSGAFLNGRRLAVSSTDALIRSLLVTGFNYDRATARANLSYWEHFLMNSQAVRRDGSAALNLCFIAAGRFDGYWELGLKPWDCAAGDLLVREAGGLVTDFDAHPHELSDPVLLATNGIVHAAMLAGLRSPESER
ncbi:MAG TPA: inositol monophosphatase family protein [Nitrolancea sp.]|nr:inositol monophosphatase family protein [Nitrolancea sp.]